MNKITPVVAVLLIINVVVYIATMNWESRLMLAMFPPGMDFFRPFQIVTHFFMHGNLTHIMFNMFGLYMFGSIMEQIWGAKAFLGYYLLCALGAAGIQVFAWQTGLTDPAPILGASGAVYGVLVGFAILFPNHRIMLLIPPIPMKAKYMIAALIAFDLTLGISGAASGVAHFAHLGGAVFGGIYTLLWRRSDKGRRLLG